MRRRKQKRKSLVTLTVSNTDVAHTSPSATSESAHHKHLLMAIFVLHICKNVEQQEKLQDSDEYKKKDAIGEPVEFKTDTDTKINMYLQQFRNVCVKLVQWVNKLVKWNLL